MKQFLNSRRYNGRVQDNANQMKILMVSDAGSIHTERWTAALKGAGMDIVLFSITPAPDDFYEKNSIKLYFFDLFRYKKEKNVAKFSRFISHVKAVNALKKVIREEKPDILHAHYATSYGLVAALAGFHPLVVSVWGSDVYEFPEQSRLNRMMVEYILSKADRVLSTSNAMAVKTSRYYRGDIGITPFGVDTGLFRPCRDRSCGERVPDGEDTVVFGTVKTLSRKYGIDLLVRAFAMVKNRLADKDGHPCGARLVIAGGGPDRKELEALAAELGVGDSVIFAGRTEHDEVPRLYDRMDVAVFLSREESFGVSAVEAMSCGVPVIASDADGFREILAEGAGVIVPRENPEAAADAMMELAGNPSLRHRLGEAGRMKAVKYYNWQDNVAAMEDEYRNLLDKFAVRGR